MNKRGKIASFDEQLETVRGTIYVVNVRDEFQRRNKSLLYYWNCAEPLFQSAETIWSARGSPDVAAMLVGMSLELLLKGIHVAFGRNYAKTHELLQLCSTIGISVNPDDAVILQALSQAVSWASRYPAPNNDRRLFEANDIFDKQRRKSGNLANLHIEARVTSRDNCERLWEFFACHYHRAREARFESAEPQYKER